MKQNMKQAVSDRNPTVLLKAMVRWWCLLVVFPGRTNSRMLPESCE